MVIRSNLKILMEKSEFTMRSMCEKTGLSTRTIYNARGGLIVNCTVFTLMRFATALGCRVKDLFDEIEEEPEEPEEPPAKAEGAGSKARRVKELGGMVCVRILTDGSPVWFGNYLLEKKETELPANVAAELIAQGLAELIDV